MMAGLLSSPCLFVRPILNEQSQLLTTPSLKAFGPYTVKTTCWIAIKFRLKACNSHIAGLFVTLQEINKQTQDRATATARYRPSCARLYKSGDATPSLRLLLPTQQADVDGDRYLRKKVSHECFFSKVFYSGHKLYSFM